MHFSGICQGILEHFTSTLTVAVIVHTYRFDSVCFRFFDLLNLQFAAGTRELFRFRSMLAKPNPKPGKHFAGAAVLQGTGTTVPPNSRKSSRGQKTVLSLVLYYNKIVQLEFRTVVGGSKYSFSPVHSDRYIDIYINLNSQPHMSKFVHVITIIIITIIVFHHYSHTWILKKLLFSSSLNKKQNGKQKLLARLSSLTLTRTFTRSTRLATLSLPIVKSFIGLCDSQIIWRDALSSTRSSTIAVGA